MGGPFPAGLLLPPKPPIHETGFDGLRVLLAESVLVQVRSGGQSMAFVRRPIFLAAKYFKFGLLGMMVPSFPSRQIDINFRACVHPHNRLSKGQTISVISGLMRLPERDYLVSRLQTGISELPVQI